RRRRDGMALLLPLDRLFVACRPAPPEAGPTRSVECGTQRIVQRSQSHFVAGSDLLAGTHEPCTGAVLLSIDDGAEDSLERRIKLPHEWVRLVQPAAVDSHHHLRPRCVERLPLQPLDRFAADFPVQMSGARTRFEAGERRLMCGPSGENDEAAAAGGSRRIEWNRLSG